MTEAEFKSRLAAKDGRYAALFAAAPPAPPAPPPRTPCRFEGAVAEPAACACDLRHVRFCDHPENETDRCTRGPNNGAVACCATCRHHAPKAGVAVGCYGMPGLARLQVKAIRAACGPDVPILLADDASPHGAEFRAIADAAPGVTFWPNADRFGHYAGDLSVFWKALQWAATTGLRYVCKLSQRFVWTEPGWLDRAAADLAASGHATLMQRCLDGGVDLYARTECVLFDAARWGAHYAEFTPRGDLGNPTELAVWHHVHTLFGGQFCAWAALPVDRYAAAPGTLWHGSHPAAAYHEYAARLGVRLGDDFHVAGAETRPDWKRG